MEGENNRPLSDAPAVTPLPGVPAAAAQEATSARRLPGIANLAERFGLLLILAGLVAVFGSLNSVFVSSANWQALISSQSVVLVIALGLMVPLVTGNFDLSVGSVAILSSIILAGLQQNQHVSLLVGCLAAIGVSVGVGLVNALLVTKLRLNALIATLGTSTLITGFVQFYTGGNAIVNGISTGLVDFGSNLYGGVPSLALVAAGLAVVMWYVLAKTPYGRKLFAIGSSKAAAELVGIRTNRVVSASFVLASTLSGIAGVMMLSQQGSGNPAAEGLSVLLPALAAVYLGSSTLFPGQFNVPGTILGLLLVGVLVSGLTLEGVANWVQPVAIGGALLIAVGTSEAFRRQRK